MKRSAELRETPIARAKVTARRGSEDTNEEARDASTKAEGKRSKRTLFLMSPTSKTSKF